MPKPVQIASFSSDASLIASIGFHDALIKIWRRQSFGSEDTRFDFTYLQHPNAVTGIRWRNAPNKEYPCDNVLYSICADNKIRIWAAVDPHGLQALQYWAEIDMTEAIQPRNQIVPDPSNRYAFFIDSNDFDLAAQASIRRSGKQDKAEKHSLEHLYEIAKKPPEICIVIDAQGHMSAWGLESVGCKIRTKTNVFNIAHVENVDIPFWHTRSAGRNKAQVVTFNSTDSDTAISILFHRFDGSIQWFEAEVTGLFSTSPRNDRLFSKALWTGHTGPIKKIVRSPTGRAIFSRTEDNEGLIWKQQTRKGSITLASSLNCSEHIHRTCLLREGDYIVNLHHEKITLWDARAPEAVLVASCEYKVFGKPLCLIVLPQPSRASTDLHLATISSAMQGFVLKVILPRHTEEHPPDVTGTTADIKQFCTFDIGMQNDLAFVLPVDPAGSPILTSGLFDAFAKDVAVSYTDRGVLRTWTAAIDVETSQAKWLPTSTVETSIMSPSLASTSSIRKSAVVDSIKTGLTIWDMSSGQLEYEARYETREQIQDLDWSSTPDDQSILAIGFPHKVIVLAQMRFDYLSVGPAWASIREISIKESTSHHIGDSTWLSSGTLVIGAGNQLYAYDKDLLTSDSVITDLSIPKHDRKAMDLFKLVAFLNGPLPVFHPQFLGQCILAGKSRLVQKIVVGLHKALRYFTTGDELDGFLSLEVEDFYSEQEVWVPIRALDELANIGRPPSTWLRKRCALPTPILLKKKIWRQSQKT